MPQTGLKTGDLDLDLQTLAVYLSSKGLALFQKLVTLTFKVKLAFKLAKCLF